MNTTPTEAPSTVRAAMLDEMVNRFLCWRLPDTFSPDGGITFKKVYNETSPFGPSNHEPIGTNLFSADEARAMLLHVVGDLLEEVEEGDRLRSKLSDILTRTVNAIKGEPPDLTLWSWHDLPELAAAAARWPGVLFGACRDAESKHGGMISTGRVRHIVIHGEDPHAPTVPAAEAATQNPESAGGPRPVGSSLLVAHSEVKPDGNEDRRSGAAWTGADDQGVAEVAPDDTSRTSREGRHGADEHLQHRVGPPGSDRENVDSDSERVGLSRPSAVRVRCLGHGWVEEGLAKLEGDAYVMLLDPQATPTLPAAEAPSPQKYDDTLLPFVALMRAELHANSRKGDRPGWLTMSREVGLLEIYWHTAKLSAAVKNNDAALIREHCADVANMAMMLLDVCGGLATPPTEPSSDTPRPVQPAEGEAPSEPLPRVEVLLWSDECATFLNVSSVARNEDGSLQVMVSRTNAEWASLSDIAYRSALKQEPADNSRRQAFMSGAKWMHGLLASPPPEAQAPSEPVLWQWRWTNPGGYENQPDEMLAWKLLDPSPGQTVQQRIDELLAYRHKGEPCYEVRALYAAPRDAVHAAISRALLEGGVTHEVLCGMCIEVGLEAFDAALKGEAP